jgi:hypothetical protein
MAPRAGRHLVEVTTLAARLNLGRRAMFWDAAGEQVPDRLVLPLFADELQPRRRLKGPRAAGPAS